MPRFQLFPILCDHDQTPLERASLLATVFSDALRFLFDFHLLANASLDCCHSSSFLLLIITYSLTPVLIYHRLVNRRIYLLLFVNSCICASLLPPHSPMLLFFTYSLMVGCYSSLVPQGMRQFLTYVSRHASILTMYTNACFHSWVISQCMPLAFTCLLNACIYSPSIPQCLHLFFIYSAMPAFILHLVLNACIYSPSIPQCLHLFFIYSSMPLPILHLFLNACIYSLSIPQCLSLFSIYSSMPASILYLSLNACIYFPSILQCLHLFFIDSSMPASILDLFLNASICSSSIPQCLHLFFI